ncbi:MAG: hypothetical protein ACLTFB_02400 [Candidatus Phytoplasma pyri]|uniref:hypothetical protein n=1 Tax=Candidatus Phytoplasma pyri TaxID=47566 RepID=UPI0039838EF7
MFTSNFKNKKFLSLFFVICLIFLPFFSNLKILADGAAASSAGETTNKRDLAQYIRDKNAGILYIGPIRYNEYDNSTSKSKPLGEDVSSVLEKIILPADLKIVDDYQMDIDNVHNKITLKLTDKGKKIFQGDVVLTFDNDLERLQINDNTIKLTKEQFDNLKDNNKYESLIQAIGKTNPSTTILFSDGKDLIIGLDSDKKVVTIQGAKLRSPGNKEFINFANSRTIKLEVSNPQTTTSTTTNDDNSISWLVWSIIIIFVAVMGVIAFRIFKNKR